MKALELECVHKSSVFSVTDTPPCTRTWWWSNFVISGYGKENKRGGEQTKCFSLCCLPAEAGRWWVPKYFLPWWIVKSLINSSPDYSKYTTKSACSKAAAIATVIKWLLDHWELGLNSFWSSPFVRVSCCSTENEEERREGGWMWEGLGIPSLTPEIFPETLTLDGPWKSRGRKMDFRMPPEFCCCKDILSSLLLWSYP